MLLAKGCCKTPRAQNRYDVFLRKGYRVSDIIEVMSIQREDILGPICGVKSSDPYIMGSHWLMPLKAPQAWRQLVASEASTGFGGSVGVRQ